MFKINYKMIKSIKQQLGLFGDEIEMESRLISSHPEIPVEQIKAMVRMANAERQYDRVAILKKKYPSQIVKDALDALEASGGDTKLTKDCLKDLYPNLPDAGATGAIYIAVSQLKDECKIGCLESMILFAMIQLRRNGDVSATKKMMMKYFPDVPEERVDDALRIAKDRLDSDL